MLQLQHLPTHALGRHHNYVCSTFVVAHRTVCVLCEHNISIDPYTLYIYISRARSVQMGILKTATKILFRKHRGK
jgi:hypothetical protein